MGLLVHERKPELQPDSDRLTLELGRNRTDDGGPVEGVLVVNVLRVERVVPRQRKRNLSRAGIGSVGAALGGNAHLAGGVPERRAETQPPGDLTVQAGGKRIGEEGIRSG